MKRLLILITLTLFKSTFATVTQDISLIGAQKFCEIPETNYILEFDLKMNFVNAGFYHGKVHLINHDQVSNAGYIRQSSYDVRGGPAGESRHAVFSKFTGKDESGESITMAQFVDWSMRPAFKEGRTHLKLSSTLLNKTIQIDKEIVLENCLDHLPK